MEHKMILVIGILLAVVLIYRLAGARKNRKNKRLERVRASYGKIPERNYTSEELKKIRTYSEHMGRGDDFRVDDITWNDLDMDALFAAVNHTFSTVGEEVLYDMLRRPVFDSATLKERARVIRFFDENADVREALSAEYISVGRIRKYSSVEFLYAFRDLKLKSDIVYFTPLIMILLSIFLMILKPLYGIIALIAVIILSLVMYFREKAEIEPYYVSLSAMAYLVNAAKKTGRNQIPDLAEYLKVLHDAAAETGALTRGLTLLGNVGKTGADPLQLVLDYIRMISHIDLVCFNRMVRTVVSHEEAILNIIGTLGFLEAMISVSSFRASLPYYTEGETDKDLTGIRIEDGFHPLVKEPVPNTLFEDRPVLITGSNASGKSTFLRMTALASLMAQSVCTVCARSYKAPFYRLFSSMALRDDLRSSESYFIVEIRSMKRILDAADLDQAPVLCFVDEVLRGTNTIERIAASSQILEYLKKKGVFVFAATHDIELSKLLENDYANYHFTEDVGENTVTFSYKLLEGSALTRNAIRLLEMTQYPEDIYRQASEEAERFEKTGVWSL